MVKTITFATTSNEPGLSQRERADVLMPLIGKRIRLHYRGTDVVPQPTTGRLRYVSVEEHNGTTYWLAMLDPSDDRREKRWVGAVLRVEVLDDATD